MSNTKELSLSPSSFPYQKRSQKQKTKDFFKDCIKAGADISSWTADNMNSPKIRSPRKNKIINYNLINNIVDKAEMNRAIDPFRIQFQDMPLTYRNYPLLNSNIMLLSGEERKRTFSPMFVLTSSDAVTQKLRDINDRFEEFAMEKVSQGIQDQTKLERAIQDFAKWTQFGYKDKREQMANQVIQYFFEKERLKEKFSRGFEDLMIGAEEIYVIDIIGKEPVVRKGNPINFHTLRGGTSYKIEDNDIIVEDGYLSPGETVDRYYEYLKPEDIRKIEEGYAYRAGAKKGFFREQLKNQAIDFDSVVQDIGLGNLVMSNQAGTSYFSGSYDDEGNIRVVRVVWRGFKKIGILEYYDQDGEFVQDIVPETYEVDEERGEKIEWKWITEWYEGTRIGEDIFVKMQPIEIQMRKMDNLSYSRPNIVGNTFNIDGNQARSIVDLGKEYQYLYNVIMYRTELGIAKYLGKVGKINSAMIPRGWDMSKFMSYLYNMNLMIEDPFNEGMKGAATGKLAGSMSQTGNSTEIGDAEFIQRHLEILAFIQNRINDITGITDQRKGAIDNRETVGGVERAVMQSSHITEKWFGVHDDVKLRVLECLLEAVKIAWKDKSFVRSYVLDDGTESILDFDYETFNESDYGGHINSSSEDINIMVQMKQLSQHLVQNGAPMSMIVELMRTKDIGTLQRKIALMEMELEKKQQQAQEAEMQANQEAQAQVQEVEMMKLELEAEQKELDREMDQYKIDTEAQTRIAVAEINAYRFQEDWDKNNDGIPDPSQIADQALKERALLSEQMNADQERRLKEKELQRKSELENKKIALEKKKLEAQKKIQQMKDTAAMEREKLKAKTALKNPVVGEAKKKK
jgi:hypothetical protein